MRIDLNADLGEGVGDDLALLEVVTSANVATGAHAGGGSVLRAAVAAAVERGVAVGAHPSYRDREGFGRRSDLAVLRADAAAAEVFVADLVAQVMAVAEQAERAGVPLAHVKPHGALYNDAAADPLAAELVLAAVVEVAERCGHPVALLALPGGELARRAAGEGVEVIAEGFVDRGYLPTGHLVPRSESGAVHTDLASMVAQAQDLAAGRVRAVDGSLVDVAVGSVCVHGDTPGAIAAARAVRRGLAESGWQVLARDAEALSYARVAQRLLAGWAGGHPAPHVAPFGDAGMLVTPADGTHPGTPWVLAAAAAARRARPDASVRHGLASVLVTDEEPLADPVRAHHQLHAALLAGLGPGPGGGARSGDEHLIEVRYDGEDLSGVAAALGLSTQEFVARHMAATWTVAALGFSPGFGYLTCADPLFGAVPRRSQPRSRVPAGALAVAAGMSAVYPSASPGGWQLVGSSDEPLFDPESSSPSRLAAGDEVRFVVR